MINVFQKEFLVQAVYSKPLGFYNWNEELQELWRFMRYFQMQYSEKDKLTILLSIGKLIHEDTLYNTEERLKEVIDFYSHLTNPPNGITLVDIIERGIFRVNDLNLTALSGELNRSLPLLSLLSISNSPEALLFNKLNTRGVDLTTIDLMQVFIEAIQSGEVDLSLKPDSGWYDYMVYALETLILPKRGPENSKIFYTGNYKKRLLNAFKVLLIKERETHIRQFGGQKPPGEAAAEFTPPSETSIRIEPAATVYLRTARGYTFLEKWLVSLIGEEELRDLRIYSEEGLVSDSLGEELNQIKNLYYGFYLVVCQDIGLVSDLGEGEVPDKEEALSLAREWIKTFPEDPAMQMDTRVAVPIFFDPDTNRIKIWATIGVKKVKLKPTVLQPGVYFDPNSQTWFEMPFEAPVLTVAVDDSVEVYCNGPVASTREELREICDREKNREAIIQALSQF